MWAMPEGDTIHYAASRIRAVLEQRVPQEILAPAPRAGAGSWPARLAGRRVRAVDAHGKHLFLRFEGGAVVHSHLRMSGSWAVHADGERWPRARSRAWLVLRCEGWEVVQFDGPVLQLMSELRVRSEPSLCALGPDILGESFDAREFLRRLRCEDPRRPIGDALLDQRTLAGIGNVWKAESCFLAGVSPWRASGEVHDGQALAIVAAARERMQQSARDGLQARPRAVYGRAGQPCVRCGAAVRRRGQWEDNRLTYWCAVCQR